MSATWSSSDAWIFSAIEGSGPTDGSTLRRLVGNADVINHSIPNEEEFVQAIPRLVAAGLIGAADDGDRFWLTEAGTALRERVLRRRGLFGWVDAIPPALHALCEPQDGEWALPPGAFRRAVDDYLGRS